MTSQRKSGNSFSLGYLLIV